MYLMALSSKGISAISISGIAIYISGIALELLFWDRPKINFHSFCECKNCPTVLALPSGSSFLHSFVCNPCIDAFFSGIFILFEFAPRSVFQDGGVFSPHDSNFARRNYHMKFMCRYAPAYGNRLRLPCDLWRSICGGMGSSIEWLPCAGMGRHMSIVEAVSCD